MTRGKDSYDCTRVIAVIFLNTLRFPSARTKIIVDKDLKQVKNVVIVTNVPMPKRS